MVFPSVQSIYPQITYSKVRNLQIGVEMLVGKVSTNLFHHSKPASCTIIIVAPTDAFCIQV